MQFYNYDHIFTGLFQNVVHTMTSTNVLDRDSCVPGSKFKLK